jgi:signal transduction histidine kinase
VKNAAILVVDDNEIRRYAKSRTLRSSGFEIVEATTTADARRLLAERRFKLAIIDIGLPDMDGREFSRELKNAPDTSSMLVLQVSASFVTPADMVSSLEHGADATLIEPIDPLVLLATVRALLRARIAEDQLREALGREQSARALAEEANRSKDELLAVISHELRSPLSAILTWTTVLRSGGIDPEVGARGLDAIERNARLQSKLIEDLLDVSRIIFGKATLKPEATDVRLVLETAVEGARESARKRGVELGLDAGAGLPPLVADPARLLQVFANLLSNAVKFTPAGGRVDVRAGLENRAIVVRVTDTGRGIATRFLPHVFDRFRQADASTTRREGGLGLGLAIVRHLVQQHGGAVAAESAGEGQGTTITVTLPLEGTLLPSTAALVPPSGDHAGVPVRLDGLTVLVVDDELDALDAITIALEGFGAKPIPVGSVQAAMTEIQRALPDVVLSDVGMPQEDGFALIRQLRALPDEQARQLPALALTAFASAGMARQLLEAGFDGFLGKPAEIRELAATIGSMVAASRLRTRREGAPTLAD